MSATDEPEYPVSAAELEATVLRMEAKFQGEAHPEVQHLFNLYKELCLRFEADLGPNRRDVALAKSAALMLIQARRAAA